MTSRIIAALTLLAALAFAAPRAVAAGGMLVEAESFNDYGGWSLDTQFISIMGSSYLLAHGLGEPVKDATTTMTFPEAGTYRVFARTKDWVAHWNAPGQPGRFQLLVNGKPLETTFGTEGANGTGNREEPSKCRPVTCRWRCTISPVSTAGVTQLSSPKIYRSLLQKHPSRLPLGGADVGAPGQTN